MYEIVMPQLSDTMDEGKLISWKVNIGDTVNSGDTIAEVESDKAVMEVQTFKNGIIKELKAKAGDEVKVGSVIATIDVSGQGQAKPTKEPEAQKPITQPKTEETLDATPAPKTKPEANNILDELFGTTKDIQKQPITHAQNTAQISPKAKAKASAYGIDIDMVAHKNSQEVVNAQDVDIYLQEKYFTPKAIKLLKEYNLTMSLFEMKHKIDEHEIKEYIASNEIPMPLALTPMQKAIITNVTASAKRPVYHLYESIDANLLTKHQQYSITVWLIKILAKVMMKHDTFRSTLNDDSISVWPNASISIAVANDKDLYMPVIKDANTLTASEIEKNLKAFKTKLTSSSFVTADMQGSTLGISNLGMLGVERFDAMINKNDAAVIAVGANIDGKISLTLTADHSLINGYEAALFMQDIKEEVKNPLNFKD